MDCPYPSFITRFYNLTLVTSSLLGICFDEFNIFSTPLDVHCGFCILSCYVTSFGYVLFLVSILFAYESKPISLAILLISTILNVSISFLS
jgi:hypothetical protein